MDVFEAIKARQSVRAYQAKEVEPATLEKILSAANQAPSAGNLQALHIYVIRDEKRKRALARAALDQTFLIHAPLALVFCAEPTRAAAKYGARGAELYSVQDATIAVAYAQLAATALGLATCWVGAIDEVEVAHIIGTVRSQRPIAILPVGYPGESPPRNSRRALSELVTDVRP